jgi:RNA polymerase sigma-70 factor, ECF subfamily
LRTEDAELVLRCRDGDRGSFDELVRRHYALGFNTAFRMLGDRDLAADAIQAAFVRAYKAIGRFRQDATFATWLYRIVTNVCLDRLRQLEKTAQSLTLPDDDGDGALEEMEVADRRGGPVEGAERKERQALVHEALQRLAPEHRAVLVLYDLHGSSYEEIAAALDVPLGTVKSRLNRARHALKEKLMPHRELFD